MIDMIFLLVSFCVADDSYSNGWNCNGKIYIPSEERYMRIVEGYGYTYTSSHGGLAVTGALYHTIYLNRVVMDDPTYFPQFGCNIVWHEILHVMGYSHEEMPVTYTDCYPGVLKDKRR